MNKQPEVTDKTRRVFIEVFCDLYKTRSIDRITVKELTAKAGYSRATFYNYFTDVYDLLEYIEEEMISDMMKRIKAQIKDARLLEGFIDSFVESVNDNQNYISVFMNGSNRASFIEKMKQKMIPLLLSVFSVSEMDLTARYALEFYIGGLIPVLGTWFRDGQPLPASALGDLIRSILQDGLLSQIRSHR